MNNKLHKIAIATMMTLVIGIFSMNAYGQMSKQQAINEVTNYINYYNNLAQQWQTYLDQKVRPYYNDRTYGRWAREEYQKGFQQIESARNYVQYYQNQLMALKSAGPQVPSDCRYRGPGSISEHVNGCGNGNGNVSKPGTIIYANHTFRRNGETRTLKLSYIQYDDGSADTREYDRRRQEMFDAGWKFVVSRPTGETQRL